MVLAPGAHLVELEFARPVPEAVLRDALARMAFEDVILDASTTAISSKIPPRASPESLIPDLWTGWREWGGIADPHDDAAIRYRFVARLVAPLQTFDTPHVRWLFVHELPLAVHEAEGAAVERSPAIGAELARGATYGFRFLTRMLSQPTRAAVCEALAVMGFRPHKVIMLKRNMRIPGLPNASVARWYGIGRWECADSVLTGDDPLFFEEIASIASEP
jgi:hypothetical protein